VLDRHGTGRRRMLSSSGAGSSGIHWCHWKSGGNSDDRIKCHSGRWTVLEAIQMGAMCWWHLNSLAVNKLPVGMPSIAPVFIITRHIGR
jgi:hypothetical protein